MRERWVRERAREEEEDCCYSVTDYVVAIDWLKFLITWHSCSFLANSGGLSNQRLSFRESLRFLVSVPYPPLLCAEAGKARSRRRFPRRTRACLWRPRKPLMVKGLI